MQWRTVLYVTQRAIILKINPQEKYASIADLSLAPNLASFFQRRMNVRFGSKADMCSALGDVRFVPIADIAHLRIEASIFLMLDDVGTDPKTGRLCRLARGSHLLCRF